MVKANLPSKCKKCSKAFPPKPDGSISRYFSALGWVCLACKKPLQREIEKLGEELEVKRVA